MSEYEYVKNMTDTQFMGRLTDLLDYIVNYQKEDERGEDIFSGLLMSDYAKEARIRWVRLMEMDNKKGKK